MEVNCKEIVLSTNHKEMGLFTRLLGVKVVNQTQQVLFLRKIDEHFEGDDVSGSGGDKMFKPGKSVRIRYNAYKNEKVNYYVYSHDPSERIMISKARVYSNSEIWVTEKDKGDKVEVVVAGGDHRVQPVRDENISSECELALPRVDGPSRV